MDLHEGGSPRRRARRWLRFWGVLGVVALGLLSAQAYNDHVMPTPYDLTVLSQADWTADVVGSLHVRLLSRDGGRPVPGRRVAMTLSGPAPGRFVRLAVAETGRDGSASPRFRVPDWPEGEYRLRVEADTDRGREVIARGVKLRNPCRVMLSTDKPVYQPGQVIRLRGLALRRRDQRPRAGLPMDFAVVDPKGNVVYRRHVPTSAFGIGSADCPLATELIEGPYRVECRVGEETSQATVEVKTYVLPRLKVVVDLDRPYYGPGEAVRGTVRASYVFGKPVRDGKVTVTLEPASAGASPIATIEPTTDASGQARFEARLPEVLTGLPQQGGDARVLVTATVRDTAGQNQSAAVSRVVTTQPIRIEVVAESGALVRDLPNRIWLLTSTPEGRPVRTRLTLVGLDRELRTDDLGLATLEWTPRTDVAWTIRAVDDEGREGRKTVSLRCGDRIDDFLLRTDRAVLRGGEPLKVDVLGYGSEPIFLDLIKDGQTALSTTIPLERGRGTLAIDLPPEVSGTVVLCAYRYRGDGLPIRKTRVLQVEPARGLTVRATLDRDEYRPGERARLRIDLADDRGRPAPGAVSLAAVDEAVFHVLDRRPGLESTFFALEQELLRPVYEIHDWSPGELDAAPPDARDRFEQALFARTARRADNPLDELNGALGPAAEEIGSALRVLERPDWEDLARGLNLSAKLIDTLRKGGGPHTLWARSYPEKLRTTEAARAEAGRWIGLGWLLLAIVAIVSGLAWLCLHVWGAIHVVVLFLVLTVMAALLLPAVQSAREAARRTSALNDLKELELSMSAPGAARAAPEADAGPVRVRRWFPETLLWRPELITDDRGRATLDLDLADSITTWRLTAGAVASDGRLGGTEAAIRVFQPFFVDLDLPAALTRGDELAVPIVVSNYRDRSLNVTVRVDDAPGFERLEEGEKTLALAPGEVRAAHYRLRARAVGRHELQVTARGEGIADAVRRPVEVVPDGRRVEQVVSGSLQQPAGLVLDVPEGAVEGSVQAVVKLYPSSFSQLVEGLDAIFQMPHGCFEQTSSTTYPNVLALDYLRRTGRSVPQVEAKARQYIHLGYQRLLSFEIPGGGFDWFGHPPANRTLTAYGLMEFRDMARVHDVDPNLIQRTRGWLLDQQRPDGSWDPEWHLLHGDPTRAGAGESLPRLSTTAYIAWSVFGGGERDAKAGAALAYLRSHPPASIGDPYTLALVANALAALEPSGDAARPYIAVLERLRKKTDDGRQVWWGNAEADRRTLFYGGGQGRSVETTALAALALLSTGQGPETVRGALAWLVASKDGRGLWYSTQATVLALKALLAGTGRPLGGDRPRRIALRVDDRALPEVAIAADQADVVRQLDLSHHMRSGRHRLTLEDRSGTGSAYQVVFRYHRPEAPEAEPEVGPLAIALDYDRTTVAVDDLVTVTATVTNRGPATVPMVLVDLPIPPGFAPEAADLEAWVASGIASKSQRTARQVLVYLRDLMPGTPLPLRYRLRATMPVRVTTPAARAYSYYEPERRGEARPARLTVDGR